VNDAGRHVQAHTQIEYVDGLNDHDSSRLIEPSLVQFHLPAVDRD
jgi:hypothetical protein